MREGYLRKHSVVGFRFTQLIIMRNLIAISLLFALGSARMFGRGPLLPEDEETTTTTTVPEVEDDFDFTEPESEVSLVDDDFNRADSVPDDEIDWQLLASQSEFEGDIKGMTQESMKEFVQQVNEINRTPPTSDKVARQNAIRNPHKLWPNKRVPYVISSYFGAYSKSIIASAIKEYERLTCIRFVPRNGERDYVFITIRGGCWSRVGRDGGRQELSLGSGCVRKATIVHEMMHAAGFFHEQSRADRDSYIRVLWNNINRGMWYNFDKYDLNYISHLGTSYDYNSVMHYPAYAFSANGRATIQTLKSGGSRIGYAPTLSANDIVKINKLYSCSGTGGGGGEEETNDCTDSHAWCGHWANHGYCSHYYQAYKNYMKAYCKKSCSLC